jgi:hypothetical protein
MAQEDEKRSLLLGHGQLSKILAMSSFREFLKRSHRLGRSSAESSCLLLALLRGVNVINCSDKEPV